MGFDLDNLADFAMCVLDTGLIVLKKEDEE